MNIETLAANDAHKFFKFLEQLSFETDYLMFSSSEVPSEEVWKKRIEANSGNGPQIFFVVKRDNEIVGFILLTRGGYKKNMHASSLVIGVLEKHRKSGLGSKLIDAAVSWAQKHQIKRIELSVMVNNDGAFQLYKKNGFQVEGIKNRSIFYNNEFIDEYLMAKHL